MQSDVKRGDSVALAGEDLTGKEGYLVYLTHDTGVPEVKLPSAITDLALDVVVDGGADGENVSLRPLEPGMTVRGVLKGTCNPGDVLVLAAIAGSDAGKVRALPTAGGTYRGIAVACEKGVDGQCILMRPAMIGNITVSS